MHPVKTLFENLSYIDIYPEGMTRINKTIPGLAFFPGGWGLWIDTKKRPICNSDNLPPMPISGIMVLGQDFDTVKNYSKSLGNGSESEKSPTWRNLIELLKSSGISLEQCFFTNAYMGVRDEDKAIGASPAAKDNIFTEQCRRFFIEQLKAQQPSVILALGRQVLSFLSSTSEDLSVWSGVDSFRAIDDSGYQVMKRVRFNNYDTLRVNIVALVHPSMRKKNALNRKFNGYSGCDAEVHMIKDSLSFQGNYY